MQLSRTMVGAVGGVLGLLAGLGVGALEGRAFSGIFLNSGIPEATFFGVGGAVLWLADRYGIMAPPYSRPVVDLYGNDGKDPGPREGMADQPTGVGRRRQ
jgi:hypothetical protein